MTDANRLDMKQQPHVCHVAQVVHTFQSIVQVRIGDQKTYAVIFLSQVFIVIALPLDCPTTRNFVRFGTETVCTAERVT